MCWCLATPSYLECLRHMRNILQLLTVSNSTVKWGSYNNNLADILEIDENTYSEYLEFKINI